MRSVANDDHYPKLTIKPGVLDFVLSTSLMSRGIETGGILIGHQIGADIEIIRATEPGPNAVRSACTIVRDTEYCRSVLQREFEMTGADYVGEWHSHVVKLEHLSGGDIATLAGIMVDPDYSFQSFAMILINTERENGCLARGYIAIRSGKTTIEIIEVPIITTFSSFD